MRGVRKSSNRGARFAQGLEQDVAGAEELGLDRAEREVELGGDFFVALFLEVAQLDEPAVAGLELGYHFAHFGLALLPLKRFKRIRISIAHVDFHRIAVLVRVARVEGKRLDALLADEIDGVVRGNLEKPGRKREGRRVLVEALEGLAEGLDGQIVRIVRVEHHAVNEVEDGVPVVGHQLGVGLLVVSAGGAQHEFIVAPGLVGEVRVYVHGSSAGDCRDMLSGSVGVRLLRLPAVHAALAPGIARPAATAGQTKPAHAARPFRPAVRANACKVTACTTHIAAAAPATIPNAVWTTSPA